MTTIRVNVPDVIHESFEAEAVIVNLRAGLYFSLNEQGLALWELIERGATEPDLWEQWKTAQAVSADEAQNVVGEFLRELVREELIVIEGELASPSGEIPAGAKRPILQKFNDLQDLLMLDPIHDVDERGWPHAKPPEDGSPTS